MANKAAQALTMLPLALGLVGNFTSPSAAPSPAATPSGPARTTSARNRTSRGSAAPLQFSIPVATLQNWAASVIVELDGVSIGGHSAVHQLKDDCEMHLGAPSASSFSGNPSGLVLEPMNACVLDPPTGFDTWPKFGDQLVNHTVTAFGVPRIWPEHLTNAEGASNPLHAAELHPLTSLVFNGQTFDFSKNVFAGDYKGGVSEATALRIAQQIAVTVTAQNGAAEISFTAGGRIGNFTVLTLTIDRSSIQDDGNGSFRAEAEIVGDDSTTVPVHLIAPIGSNGVDALKSIKSASDSASTQDMLVLFSLSPQALLDAANSGSPSAQVNEPIQLILYGPAGVSGT